MEQSPGTDDGTRRAGRESKGQKWRNPSQAARSQGKLDGTETRIAHTVSEERRQAGRNFFASVFLSESEEAEGPGRLVPKEIKDRSDGGGPAQTKEADGHVPEGGHDLGTMAGTDSGGILPINGILDPVETVLDLPMSPDKREDPVGRRLFGGKTGDPEGGFRASASILDEDRVTINAKHLVEMGEERIAIEGGGNTNGLGLDAAVTGEGCFNGRGKNPRNRGFRCHF